MPAQITIIGLGQIGASIGLALAKNKDLLTRVGHDKDYSIAQKAQKLGAVDSVNFNLPASVREADIILIATPQNTVREILEYISQDIKEGAVVLDTSPLKTPVISWARDYLPEKRHYIGLVPALSPAYLHETNVGLDAARADLFKQSVMGIIAPAGTSGTAVKLAADLVTLLDAQPFFMDSAETDGLMAGVHLLPQLLAAALVNATAGQPGWLESRKLAGRAYASTTSAIYNQDVLGALRDEALLDKDNILRVIDNYLDAMLDLRKAIAEDDRQSLEKVIEQAFDARETWWSQRQRGNWDYAESNKHTKETLSMGNTLRQMFLGKFGRDKSKLDR